MDERLTLKAQPRELVGKKVRQLRAAGKVPAHIYGRGLPSETIMVDTQEFQKLYRDVGETGVFTIELNRQDRPVLIQGVQTDPLSGNTLHIDFHQVNLAEKVRVAVSIETVGESPAVAAKEAVLEQPLSEVEVEALPTDLPERITVDVSGLAHIDDQLTVADLVVDRDKITILTNPEAVVIKAGPLLTEEMQRALEAEREATKVVTTPVVPEEETVTEQPTEPASSGEPSEAP